MDGVRTAEGGEGVTGAMIRARTWVDGRLASRSAGAFGGTDGGLQWLWRARWRDRTRQEALAGLCWREFAGTLGWLAGQWRTGAVRLGVEWLAVGPGRG